MKIILHERKPIPRSWQWAIVRHVPRDILERDYGLEFAPDVIPVQDRPFGTWKGNDIRIKPAWWRYIKQLNPDPKNFARTVSIGSMWINIEWPQDPSAESWDQLAKAECITNGGNFVLSDRSDDSHLHLICMSPYADTSLYDAGRMDWFHTPWLFFKEIAINAGGKLINPGHAQDVFYPFLRGQAPDGKELPDRWIAKSQVEMFPALPYPISSRISIVEYLPQGCSVLGLTNGGEWIYLLKSTRPGERLFTTSWRLDTVGVIPPPQEQQNEME